MKKVLCAIGAIVLFAFCSCNNELEENVQDAGNDQVEQRSSGISDGTKNGAANVVNQQAGDSREIDDQIGGRLIKHIGRRVHQPEHRLDSGHPHDGEQDARDEGRRHDGL